MGWLYIFTPRDQIVYNQSTQQISCRHVQGRFVCSLPFPELTYMITTLQIIPLLHCQLLAITLKSKHSYLSSLQVSQLKSQILNFQTILSGVSASHFTIDEKNILGLKTVATTTLCCHYHSSSSQVIYSPPLINISLFTNLQHHMAAHDQHARSLIFQIPIWLFTHSVIVELAPSRV